MSASDATSRRVELIAVGREVLRGRVLDTNSNWLAKELTGMGGEVSRICVVDDVPQEIVRELHAAMQHGARVILYHGRSGAHLRRSHPRIYRPSRRPPAGQA